MLTYRAFTYPGSAVVCRTADRTTTSVTATGDVSATDNVFATEREIRESDVSFTFRPGVLFGYDGPRTSHEVFLEGEVLRPDAIKGLLNREARAKEKYDAARLKLLGLDESPLEAPGDGGNPFR